MSAHTAALESAWEAVVDYRHSVHADTGVWRSHLVDLDTWGVLKELEEEARLKCSPAEAMDFLIEARLQPQLPVVITDPAQEIYDAILNLLEDEGFLIHIQEDR